MTPAPDSRISPEELLARIPLFSRLDRRELKKLAALCMSKTFEAGATIVEEGTTGLGLYALVSGSVEVSKKTETEKLILATLTSGDILGEMSLIDDSPRSATAVATETTETLLITRSSFSELIAKDPKIAWTIVPTLAERIRELQERIIATELRSHAEPDVASETESAEDEANEDGEREDREPRSDLGAELLRTNYALAKATIAGFAATLEAFEEAADTMARETELKSVDAVPAGMFSALAAAMRRTERVPERMVAAFRRHRKRE